MFVYGDAMQCNDALANVGYTSLPVELLPIEFEL